MAYGAGEDGEYEFNGFEGSRKAYILNSRVFQMMLVVCVRSESTVMATNGSLEGDERLGT